MDTQKYQEEAARTLVKEPGFEIPGDQLMLVWCATGLAGETGELVELIKKGVFHHGVDLEQIAKELGDCLWYIAGVASVLGLDLGEIMQANIDKLKVRYPNGFSSEDSKARVDVFLPPSPRETKRAPSARDIILAEVGF